MDCTKVTYRAHEFGVGDDKHAVALLVSTFRWSSWTPTVYYTQLLLSAFTCLSQNGSNAKLWKAFIVGRVSMLFRTVSALKHTQFVIPVVQLPSLLVSFAEIVKAADTSPSADLVCP